MVSSLLFVKRTSHAGISPWTITFLANQWAAIVFSSMWFLGGTGQPWTMLWQPTIIALLYILGLVFTFSAIRFGDVSVATPVFGIKVVLVAVLMTFFFGEELSSRVWLAAALATVGIGCVQWSPRQKVDSANYVRHTRDRRAIILTIALAASASISFATFDVLVQHWAPAWGPGRFLPIVYWIVGFLSIGFLPAVQWDVFTKHKSAVPPLLLGTLLMALQAVCIVFTLAKFGDAARVNVVYALRGMWGVILAWLVAQRWGGNEATLPKQVMIARFVGAALLTTAVIVVVSQG